MVETKNKMSATPAKNRMSVLPSKNRMCAVEGDNSPNSEWLMRHQNSPRHPKSKLKTEIGFGIGISLPHSKHDGPVMFYHTYNNKHDRK